MDKILFCVLQVTLGRKENRVLKENRETKGCEEELETYRTHMFHPVSRHRTNYGFDAFIWHMTCYMRLFLIIFHTNVGEKGDEGFVGLQGVQGAPGQKGETGYNGWKGEVGDYGLQGVMGIDGRPGNKLVTIIIDFLCYFKYIFYLSILKE